MKGGGCFHVVNLVEPIPLVRPYDCDHLHESSQWAARLRGALVEQVGMEEALAVEEVHMLVNEVLLKSVEVGDGRGGA